MKLYITGATGLLGNNLLHALKGLDYDIHLILLEGDDESHLSTFKYTPHYGDVRDYDFIHHTITENSYVIHMAGIVDISSDDKSLLYEVNVNGTKNIVDVCMKKNCKLIYTSSVHTIVPLKKKQVMVEPTTFNPDDIVGDYAKSKTIATGYVFKQMENGLMATIVYPSGIIGEHDYKNSNTGKLILDIANKDIKVRTNGGYNFVDAKDVSYGIIEILKRDLFGETYILSGGSITIINIFKTINEYLGRTKYIPIIQTWFIKIFAGLAERYYRIRKQKPLFTAYSLYTITSNHNFSYEKAQRDLDYNPVSPEKVIIKTLLWFKNNKKELLKEEVFNKIEAKEGKKNV